MDWTLLQSFLAVAGCGSLSKAAKRLTLTQSTVSRHVQTLEEQLGVPLFVRHSRGVRLTQRGEALHRQAQGIDERIAALLRGQVAEDAEPRGVVRLSVNEPIGLFVLPEWVARLRCERPEIQIEVLVDNGITDLSTRAADIAVRMFRPQSSGLIARRVGALPLGLYAHRNYVGQHGLPSTLEEVTPRHTIAGQDSDATWLRSIAQMGLARELFALRSDSLAFLLQVGLVGGAIVGMHRALARRYPELVRVLEHVELPDLELWMVVTEEQRHDPAVACVFESLNVFLEEYVKASSIGGEH